MRWILTVLLVLTVLICVAAAFVYLLPSREHLQLHVPSDTALSDAAAPVDLRTSVADVLVELLKESRGTQVPERPALEDEPPVMTDGSKPSLVFYGTVTDKRTGAPIPGARLATDGWSTLTLEDFASEDVEDSWQAATADMIHRLNSQNEVRSDENGAYSLDTGYADDGGYTCRFPYELTCSAVGFGMASMETGDESSGRVRIDFALAPEARVAGRVVDERGGGVPGIGVGVAVVGTTWGGSYAVTGYPGALSGENGSFEIGGLPAGNFRFRADCDESSYVFDERFAPAVELTEGETVSGVELRMHQNGSVDVLVLDERGRPVHDADVGADGGININNSHEFSDGLWEDESTDKAGKATLLRLPLDVEFYIYADYEDYPTARSDPIRLTTDHKSSAATIVLSPGGCVTGTVVDTSGAPLEDVDVDIIRKGSQFGMEWADGSDFESTDEVGMFEFSQVFPGPYVVRARDSSVVVEVTAGPDCADVVLRVGEPEETAEINGVVVRSDGAPARRVKISLIDALHARTVDGSYSDEDGLFVFSEPSEDEFIWDYLDANGTFSVPEEMTLSGPYIVAARNDDGVALAENVFAGDFVSLSLTPGATVSGIVLDATGEIVPNCRCRIVQQSGTAAVRSPNDNWVVRAFDNSTFTDASGEFTFTNVASSNYVVSGVSKQRGAGSSAPFVVSGMLPVANLVVRLEPGVLLRGHVLDSLGNGLANAAVSLYLPDYDSDTRLIPTDSDREYAAATSDSQGAFAVSNVAPGAYLVQASHDDYADSALTPVSVASNRNLEGIAITLLPGGDLHGTVSIAGNPIPKALVQIIGASGVHMKSSDGSGRFTFPRVTPGLYEVSALGEDADGRTAYGTQEVAITDGKAAEVLLELFETRNAYAGSD